MYVSGYSCKILFATSLYDRNSTLWERSGVGDVIPMLLNPLSCAEIIKEGLKKKKTECQDVFTVPLSHSVHKTSAVL